MAQRRAALMHLVHLARGAGTLAAAGSLLYGAPAAASGAPSSAVAGLPTAGLLQQALQAMGEMTAAGAGIDLVVPDVADNGAVVPVSVGSRLPGTQEISILVEHNPLPLAAQFGIAADTEPMVATRIKMAASGRVVAVVRAEGRLWFAFKETTVTLSGCG